MRRALVAVLLLATACTAVPATRTTPPATPSTRAAAAASTGAPTATPTPTVTPTPTPSPSQAEPVLTLDDAANALERYLAADARYRAAGIKKYALDTTTDGQRLITIALYNSTGYQPPVERWGKRELIVPRQAKGRGPLWFAATVDRGKGADLRTEVLVMVLRDGVWKLAFSSTLDEGVTLPKLDVDADGYVSELRDRDTSIAISPNLFGPLHATIAEEGVDGFASGLIAAGPWTTGVHSEIVADHKKMSKIGLNYDSIFALAGFPSYAIRTADGGGLLLYTLTRTSTWASVDKFGDVPLAIPEGARWTLRYNSIPNERRIVETNQYIGVVPPKESTGPAQVIGYAGRIVKASYS